MPDGGLRSIKDDNWDDIAQWWVDEVHEDQAYATDVHPLYRVLTDGFRGSVIDLGCGEGQAFGLAGDSVVGVDLSHELLRTASARAPVVRCRLPDLASLRDDSFDHATSVYLVDLIEDDKSLFAAAARVVRTAGSLAMIINHPIYTAPGSAPIMDEEGEVLWRWGDYMTPGSAMEPAGPRTLEFFHRPLGQLLEHASAAGWGLVMMRERALSDRVIDRHSGYEGQDMIPRLLGLRWVNLGTDALPSTAVAGSV